MSEQLGTSTEQIIENRSELIIHNTRVCLVIHVHLPQQLEGFWGKRGAFEAAGNDLNQLLSIFHRTSLKLAKDYDMRAIFIVNTHGWGIEELAQFYNLISETYPNGTPFDLIPAVELYVVPDRLFEKGSTLINIPKYAGEHLMMLLSQWPHLIDVPEGIKRIMNGFNSWSEIKRIQNALSAQRIGNFTIIPHPSDSRLALSSVQFADIKGLLEEFNTLAIELNANRIPRKETYSETVIRWGEKVGLPVLCGLDAHKIKDIIPSEGNSGKEKISINSIEDFVSPFPGATLCLYKGEDAPPFQALEYMLRNQQDDFRLVWYLTERPIRQYRDCWKGGLTYYLSQYLAGLKRRTLELIYNRLINNIEP